MSSRSPGPPTPSTAKSTTRAMRITASARSRPRAQRRRPRRRGRHHADGRPPVVSHLLGEDPPRARICSQADDRGRRPGTGRRIQGGRIPNSMTDRAITISRRCRRSACVEHHEAELRPIAAQVRGALIEMSHRAKTAHLGSSLSRPTSWWRATGVSSLDRARRSTRTATASS